MDITEQDILDNLYAYYRNFKTSVSHFQESDEHLLLYDTVRPFLNFLILKNPDFCAERLLRMHEKFSYRKKAKLRLMLPEAFVVKNKSVLRSGPFIPMTYWTDMACRCDDIKIKKLHRNNFEELKSSGSPIFRQWLKLHNRSEMIYQASDFKQIFENESTFFFIARENENLLASSAVLLKDGCAGLYLIAVQPDFRREGLGTAITQKAVELACNKGFRKIVLHATKAARNLYRKMGFIEFGKLYIFAPVQR